MEVDSDSDFEVTDNPPQKPDVKKKLLENSNDLNIPILQYLNNLNIKS